MRIGEGISVGFTAIRANTLRSLLTMLGIIIGVASVLATIAIGNGAKLIVLQDAQKLGGANQFTLYRSNHIRKGDRWIPNRSNEYFDYEDVLAIEAGCPSVEGVIPRLPVWRGVLVQTKGGAEKRTGYEGITPFYRIGMNWEVQRGRFISDEDVENRSKVCILGSEVGNELFGHQNPIGKEIKIARESQNSWRRGRPRREKSMERFTVVGVMKPRGTSLRFGWNLDDRVLLPLTTVQERFTGNDRVRMITVQAKNLNLLERAKKEVTAIVRKRHNDQDNFFNLWEMREGMEQLFTISRTIKIVLGIIAGVSLLVGGIGIMNIMLVSVTERTREIGLRKALGAKRKDILFQFLVESVVMCSVGGLLGIGLGAAAGYGMSQIAVKIVKIINDWPSIITVQWVVISVAFSAAIGVFFGLYPAVKAARLSPIEALRTE